jgi:hypothetical protein
MLPEFYKPAKPFRILLVIIVCFVASCNRNENGIIADPVSTNLSFSQNPANNFEVGYSKADSLDPKQFLRCSFSDTNNPIGIWQPADIQPYPYTGQNRLSSSQQHSSTRWAARANQIVMEGSNTGQYSMLRFIAPRSGKYRVKAVFEGIHFGLSTTDVHILLNETRLFNNFINGYGGDTSFHKIEGSQPSCIYEDQLQLKANDILIFAVGYGSDKTHYNDTTGLLLLIEII